MNLDLTEEQELLRDGFDRLLATESSPERVRASEAQGFDPKLWRHLVESGAVGIRVPEAQGGPGASLLDAVLLAEQAGRHLVSGPLLEAIAACAALSHHDSDAARAFVQAAIAGDRVVSFAPLPGEGEPLLVPGGACATAVAGLDRDAFVIVERGAPPPRLANLGAGALARWDLSGADAGATRTVLARGAGARALFERAREEWRLLMAAALCGLGRRAIEIAAQYASERIQFDRPIGSFQAIAHPLAALCTALDGGRALVWHAVASIAGGASDAGWLPPLAFAWAAAHAPRAAHRALHTHGGYGLTDEYDIQLFHRRAKAWALTAGDPQEALLDAADRRWRGASSALPEAGAVQLDFGLGEAAEAFRLEVRRFLEAHPASEEDRANQHNWEGHDPAFQRAMAEAGLLFASWPPEYGGQSRDPFESSALAQELARAGRTIHATSVTRLVGETLMRFASDEVRREVLPKLARGEAICSLGYTEPASGSDVAAAQTRAVRDGDEWVINGQKMFTSGAERTDYIFLLTRTNPTAKKHRGLTMFLVPTDTPGIEIQPIHTLSDERTNATYYTDVRVSDAYRVGEVDQGWAVIGYALHLEHGAGGGSIASSIVRDLVERAAAWTRGRRRGGHAVLDDARVRETLGWAAAHAEVLWCLERRSLWAGVSGGPDRGEGASRVLFEKLVTTELASQLMNVTAPESILQRGAPGAIDGGALEFGYRHGTANAIYGGTAEILSSIVAQTALGMPRSRS